MIELNKVTKRYGSHTILSGADFTVKKGEFVVLTGPSGAGKSTLINLIVGAEKPTLGSVRVGSHFIEKLNPSELQVYRRTLGVVFQDYRLLPRKTVFENIAFALEACELPVAQMGGHISQALALVGLAGREKSFPNELSGGEQQRVAIARAIVHNPNVILADEPTGNLDIKNTQSIAQLFKDINEQMGVTVLFTTHDPYLIRFLNKRTVEIRDQQIWENVGSEVRMTQTVVE